MYQHDLNFSITVPQILRIDGDPTDICSLAIFAALHSAELPKLELVVGKQGAFEDFEVVPDMAANVRLPLSHLPIIVTVHKVGGKMMIDCSHDEQQCSDAAVALAVNDLYQVCSTSFTKSGSLNSADLTRALEVIVSIIFIGNCVSDEFVCVIVCSECGIKYLSTTESFSRSLSS